MIDQEAFLRDVSTHVITVHRDDGAYRHIEFGKPESCVQQFHIVTFPGSLVYTGDMGSYTFSRQRDMFGFFSGDYINPSYWAEKCHAADRTGVTRYSEEVFKQTITEWFEDWAEDPDSQKWKDETWAAIEDEVLSRGESEHEAREAVDRFNLNGLSFADFWETDLHEYTTRFLWCCYAVQWAIKQYDEWSKPKPRSLSAYSYQEVLEGLSKHKTLPFSAWREIGENIEGLLIDWRYQEEEWMRCGSSLEIASALQAAKKGALSCSEAWKDGGDEQSK